MEDAEELSLWQDKEIIFDVQKEKLVILLLKYF